MTVDGPSKVTMDYAEVEEGYRVSYIPLAAGEYFINVKYNNQHVTGSPFKVQAMGKLALARS